MSARSARLAVIALLIGPFLLAPVAGLGQPTVPQPSRPMEALAAARLRLETADLPGAQRELETALDHWPQNVELLKALGDVCLDRCLAQTGTECFRAALREGPNDVDAMRGLVRALLKGRDFEEARTTVRRGLEMAPHDPELLAARAKLLTHDRDYRQALDVLEHARQVAPDHPMVHSCLATIRFRLRDMAGSRRELIRTLRLEPENTFAHHRLGTGSGVLEKEYQGEEASQLRQVIRRSTAIIQDGSYGEARDLLRAALVDYPLHFKLHHLLALTLTELDFERHALSSFPEFRTLFDLLPDPEVPDIQRLFANFSELNGRERKIVRLAVAPLARYLPALVRAGARHHVLSLPQTITDLPQFSHLEDRTTFDHRFYAHVRGLGGLYAATGREYLHEAMDFRYNTLAHEFAHQVHLHALSEEDREELDELYHTALAQDLCLDYYARSDVAEYFAQGYEAYVSLFKRPCLSSTAGHTRLDLERRDPDLYSFIRRLCSPVLEQGAWLARAYARIARIHERLGTEDLARLARIRSGGEPADSAPRSPLPVEPTQASVGGP